MKNDGSGCQRAKNNTPSGYIGSVPGATATLLDHLLQSIDRSGGRISRFRAAFYLSDATDSLASETHDRLSIFGTTTYDPVRGLGFSPMLHFVAK